MNNLRIVKHVSKDGDDEYLILEEYPEIDYTLLIREAKYEPYVAAWGYNKEGNYWAQGHYFSTLLDAMFYIQSKLFGRNHGGLGMNKRQLEIGDTIRCQGIKATIASIAFQEPWEWRNAWYLEFTDTNGVYRSWKQNCDGGTAYDKEGKEI